MNFWKIIGLADPFSENKSIYAGFGKQFGIIASAGIFLAASPEVSRTELLLILESIIKNCY